MGGLRGGTVRSGPEQDRGPGVGSRVRRPHSGPGCYLGGGWRPAPTPGQVPLPSLWGLCTTPPLTGPAALLSAVSTLVPAPPDSLRETFPSLHPNHFLVSDIPISLTNAHLAPLPRPVGATSGSCAGMSGVGPAPWPSARLSVPVTNQQGRWENVLRVCVSLASVYYRVWGT